MTNNLFFKCLSISSAMLLLGVTLFIPKTSSASEDDSTNTSIKCPDGNIYICATNGGITAYKGKGETIIIVQ